MIGHFHDATSRLLFRVAASALAAIVVLYLYEVVARYFFNAPTTWSGEAVRYALAGLMFLSLPEVTRRSAHVAIDILPEMLPPSLRRLLAGAGLLVSALVSSAASGIVTLEAIRQFERGLMTNAAHPIPRWWITTVIAIGLASAALHFLRQGFAGAPREADPDGPSEIDR
ncbi:MAG: TRAP transporter small permease [Pseudomonadota bacterium]